MNRTNNVFHYLSWPVQNVVAFTTTVHHPEQFKRSSSYGNFNLGLHVGDDKSILQSNRNLLLNYLPEKTSIQWLEQVHGNNVEVITTCSGVLIADASITQQKNIALAVMTADCLPIIISSLDGSEIAVIHGGWKPLSQNIIEQTLLKMNTAVQDLHVWLGPCIGPASFEVGKEVYEQFISIDSDFKKAFVAFKSSENEIKYLANLHLIAQVQLEKLGAQYVYSLPHCTFTQTDDYYSYRRSHKTGRMATMICRT
ncbi:peptidoglycan editing factor PgeF [Pseudocolwellia sp. HL-MZ19]|uniref:peptidoglycan editing factor PgeF n=1 Tax=unclassified Pseudocolwellia TaxID=2848178 RepID=UPI003CEC2D0C